MIQCWEMPDAIIFIFILTCYLPLMVFYLVLGAKQERKALVDAVKIDALEQVVRPLFNK